MPRASSSKKAPRLPSRSFFGAPFSLPEAEERVLAFWKEHQVFERSLELRKDGKPFVFYEGPPGANGKPGLHHLLSRVTKDVILRYRSMRGFNVPRRSGWDTHGLPVELAAEKALGMKDKRDIEKYGIAAFNRKCQELVWEHEAEWRAITDRIGFWLDLDHPYVTYSPDYIESLWWIVQEIDRKGYLYRGHKVIPWCTRCGTGLSAAEVAQGYQEVDDLSVTALFPLLAGQAAGGKKLPEKTKVAAWTTTPWTLPGNVALAVSPKVGYSVVRRGGDNVVVATDLVASLFGDDAETVMTLKGSDLVGLRYEPPFDVPVLRHDKAHLIYPADFVTTTDGTGIVHITSVYGEDDYQLCLKAGIPQIHTVDERGFLTNDVPELARHHAKDPTTEAKILAHLRMKGALLSEAPYRHEYPHCWRCQTPLLYYAKDSWFVAVSKLRKEMSARNETVNWVPEHTKEGRFGNWLREAKDWNFSRERYWGTPLPVWQCTKCPARETIGSLDQLHDRSGGAKNRYWLMRHGEAEHNLTDTLDSVGTTVRLTEKGRKEAEKAAASLKGAGIDLIVASPFLRAQETAHIAAEVLGVPVVSYDERLREVDLGVFSGKKLADIRAYWADHAGARLDLHYPGGESDGDVRRRGWYFLREFERSHAGRNVLVVGHDGPLRMLAAAAEGWSDARTLESLHRPPFLQVGAATAVGFRNLPRDEDGVVNLHRPYVDAVVLDCPSCGGHMKRASETIDVWYDSGAMPFAQAHYPFAGKELVDGGKGSPRMYPADFIAEGVDQTRGWFYSLMEVATLLGRPAPYRNVISIGFLNDKHGKKMSKSRGNAVDPWELIATHGVDAVRWYFYAATDVGDSKSFDEAELGKAVRRVHLIAYNVLSFWQTYGRQKPRAAAKPSALDRWIASRRDEAMKAATAGLEAYDPRAAVLAVEALVDDLSRWYVRSSRRRLQHPSSQADYVACAATLEETLRVLAALMAPFAPFFAEALYHELRDETDPVSVHLTDWPKAGAPDKPLLARMALVRELAAQALALRAAGGIKVRQPLRSLHIRSKALDRDAELRELLAREVNVKEVVSKASLPEEAVLDTTLTPELVAEGAARELTRAIQGLRQEAGFVPGEKAIVYADGPLQDIERYLPGIARDTASEIRTRRVTTALAEASVALPAGEAWLGIKKA